MLSVTSVVKLNCFFIDMRKYAHLFKNQIKNEKKLKKKKNLINRGIQVN